jgi:hypothetical protein
MIKIVLYFYIFGGRDHGGYPAQRFFHRRHGCLRWNTGPLSENRMTDPQPNNPLHGLTLERMLTELVDRLGWPGLGMRISIRCFNHEPSIASSLKFLRRTPWARAQVEALYLDTVPSSKRSAQRDCRHLPEGQG